MHSLLILSHPSRYRYCYLKGYSGVKSSQGHLSISISLCLLPSSFQKESLSSAFSTSSAHALTVVQSMEEDSRLIHGSNFPDVFSRKTPRPDDSLSRAGKLFRTSAQGISSTTASIPSVCDLGKENICDRVKNSDKAGPVLILANTLYYTPRARPFWIYNWIIFLTFIPIKTSKYFMNRKFMLHVPWSCANPLEN